MKLEVFEKELEAKKKETDDTSGTAEDKIRRLEQKFVDYNTERQLTKEKCKIFVLKY